MTTSKSYEIIRADGLRYDAGTKTFLGLITELSLLADVPEIAIQGSSRVCIFKSEIASSSCLVYFHGIPPQYRLELYDNLKELEKRWTELRGSHVKTAERDDHEYLADLMAETIQKEIDAEVISSIRSMPIRLI